PSISQPRRSVPTFTAARMTALSPGQSPPPVMIATRRMSIAGQPIRRPCVASTPSRGAGPSGLGIAEMGAKEPHDLAVELACRLGGGEHVGGARKWQEAVVPARLEQGLGELYGVQEVHVVVHGAVHEK